MTIVIRRAFGPGACKTISTWLLIIITPYSPPGSHLGGRLLGSMMGVAPWSRFFAVFCRSIFSSFFGLAFWAHFLPLWSQNGPPGHPESTFWDPKSTQNWSQNQKNNFLEKCLKYCTGHTKQGFGPPRNR